MDRAFARNAKETAERALAKKGVEIAVLSLDDNAGFLKSSSPAWAVGPDVRTGNQPIRLSESKRKRSLTCKRCQPQEGSPMRLRSDIMVLAWIWHTRDSVTPNTSPISARVIPS